MRERSARLDESTRAILEEVHSELRGVYGARLREVCLYGSYARGEEREGSDMDILVVLDDIQDVGQELGRMSELGSALSLAHDVTISFYPVSEWEFVNRRSPLLINIRREAILA